MNAPYADVLNNMGCRSNAVLSNVPVLQPPEASAITVIEDAQ